MSKPKSTVRWRRPPTPTLIRIAVPGTERRRPVCPMKRSQPTLSVRQSGHEREAVLRRRRPSWNAPAVLTVDPTQRTRRALMAAEAKREVGALDSALSLAAMAERGPLDESQRAQLDVLRARVSFATDRGRDAPPLFLKAASRLENIDARRASDTYLDALTAAMFAGRLANGTSTTEVARAALEAPRPDVLRGSDLLLEGLARTIADGSTTGTPLLKQALGAFRDETVDLAEQLPWLWLAGRAAGFIWDYDAWDALTARQVQVIRDEGALTVLPLTLSTRVGVHLFAGELATAASLLEETRGGRRGHRESGCSQWTLGGRGVSCPWRRCLATALMRASRTSLLAAKGWRSAWHGGQLRYLCNGTGEVRRRVCRC